MYELELHFEKSEDLPGNAYWQALEAYESQRIERVKAAKKYCDAFSHLKQEYLDALYSLIGKEKLPRYLNLHKRRIQNMRSIRKECPKTREGFKKLKEYRHKNVEKSTEIIENSGVDINRIKALQKEFKEKAGAISLEAIGKVEMGSRKPLEETRGEDWMDLTPPFQGTRKDAEVHSSNLEPTYRIHCNQYTGMMAHDSRVQIRDADNSDYATVKTFTEVCKICRVPRSCNNFGVMASFEVKDSFHQGHAEHECGFSDWSLFQDVRAVIRLKKLWPFGAIQTKLTRIVGFEPINQWDVMYTNGYNLEPSWSFQYWDIAIEDIYTGFVNFSGSFGLDDYVAVWVGIETENQVWSDDYTIDAYMSHGYKLNHIFANIH
jgi:hypothetical protein